MSLLHRRDQWGLALWDLNRFKKFVRPRVFQILLEFVMGVKTCPKTESCILTLAQSSPLTENMSRSKINHTNERKEKKNWSKVILNCTSASLNKNYDCSHQGRYKTGRGWYDVGRGGQWSNVHSLELYKLWTQNVGLKKKHHSVTNI